MPKRPQADRQVARFEDGELWCADDATPPVSPAGWYARPRGTATPWIGPFPTAEAASGAPCRGDPFAAARRRLDEWLRAGAEHEAAATPSDAPGPPRQAPDPLPHEPGPTVAEGPRPAPRQLAFGFGPGGGPAGRDEGGSQPVRRKRHPGRSGPAPGTQAVLPF